jgi:hypothetical protein
MPRGSVALRACAWPRRTSAASDEELDALHAPWGETLQEAEEERMADDRKPPYRTARSER